MKEYSDRLRMPIDIDRIYTYQRYLSPINRPSSVTSSTLLCMRTSRKDWRRCKFKIRTLSGGAASAGHAHVGQRHLPGRHYRPSMSTTSSDGFRITSFEFPTHTSTEQVKTLQAVLSLITTSRFKIQLRCRAARSNLELSRCRAWSACWTKE